MGHTKQWQNRLEVTWYVKQGSEISASVCLSVSQPVCLSIPQILKSHGNRWFGQLEPVTLS